jgi:hypothetical protein
MADAEAVPADFYLGFDIVQFKKVQQLKPYKFLRSECTRRCCVMPGGNEYLRPKDFRAFPFTVMCCSRVNKLSLFVSFCVEANLMKLFPAEADQKNFKELSAVDTEFAKGIRAMPRGAVAASCVHTRACSRSETSPMC